MSLSFEEIPRTLDTAMFRREKFADGPSVVLGWVIALPRSATSLEIKWFDANGFVRRSRTDEWERHDRDDDFVK